MTQRQRMLKQVLSATGFAVGSCHSMLTKRINFMLLGGGDFGQLKSRLVVLQWRQLSASFDQTAGVLAIAVLAASNPAASGLGIGGATPLDASSLHPTPRPQAFRVRTKGGTETD